MAAVAASQAGFLCGQGVVGFCVLGWLGVPVPAEKVGGAGSIRKMPRRR